MDKIKAFSVSVSILVLLTFVAVPVRAATELTPCVPGYVQGAVPATSTPDYSYTPDGFLELHFRLTTTRWKYNYGRLLDYDKDCNLLVGGMGMWGDKQSFAWPGVSHLVLRYAEDNPTLPGMYHFNAFNGDTGAPIALDTSTPLGTFSGSYTKPLNRPIHRIIFGNRTAADWDTETGDLISTAALPMKVTPIKRPVLIVPGMLGTDITKGSEKLWLDLGRNFTDVGDQFMDPLQLNADLTPLDTSLGLGNVIKVATMTPATLVNYDYTGGLIQEFKNQGYIEGTDLFTFPYDWRYGVSGIISNGQTNVDLLRQKIQAIRDQTGSDKVDIVAHSTGGLLVKKDVVGYPTDHHIGKAVFVGVPNIGAPKAAKVLLSGDSFGIPWLSDGEMQKISENLPVAYDLLPSTQYMAAKGSYIKVIDQGLLSSSSKDLDFSETSDFLLTDHQLNSQALTSANALHTAEFDTFDMRTTGVDLYSINGCKSGTMGNIIERRSKDVFGNTLTSYDQPQETPGDGTVPLESATSLPIDANNKYYALKATHGKMLSQDGIRQQIVNLLSRSNITVGSNLITQDETKCKLNGKAISLYSPVTITVVDALGNRASVNEDGSSIENNIPNANFEIMGEHKFVYLPDDEGQSYTISLQGSGNGVFTLRNQDISDNRVTQTEIFADLPVTTALSGEVHLDAAITTLSLDTDGDGTTDQVVEPTVVVYLDTTPPELQIALNTTAHMLAFTSSDENGTTTMTMATVYPAPKKGNQGSSAATTTVTASDGSGNSTTLVYTEPYPSPTSSVAITLQSLVYNGVPAMLAPASLSYDWRLNHKGLYQSLASSLQVGTAMLESEYKSRSDTTVITTGSTTSTLPGMVVPYVATKQGGVIINY